MLPYRWREIPLVRRRLLCRYILRLYGTIIPVPLIHPLVFRQENGTPGTFRQDPASKQPSIQRGYILIIAPIIQGWWALLQYNNASKDRGLNITLYVNSFNAFFLYCLEGLDSRVH